jgi:hypothetical protein
MQHYTWNVRSKAAERSRRIESNNWLSLKRRLEVSCSVSYCLKCDRAGVLLSGWLSASVLSLLLVKWEISSLEQFRFTEHQTFTFQLPLNGTKSLTQICMQNFTIGRIPNELVLECKIKTCAIARFLFGLLTKFLYLEPKRQIRTLVNVTNRRLSVGFESDVTTFVMN